MDILLWRSVRRIQTCGLKKYFKIWLFGLLACTHQKRYVIVRPNVIPMWVMQMTLHQNALQYVGNSNWMLCPTIDFIHKFIMPQIKVAFGVYSEHNLRSYFYTFENIFLKHMAFFLNYLSSFSSMSIVTSLFWCCESTEGSWSWSHHFLVHFYFFRTTVSDLVFSLPVRESVGIRQSSSTDVMLSLYLWPRVVNKVTTVD